MNPDEGIVALLKRSETPIGLMNPSEIAEASDVRERIYTDVAEQSALLPYIVVQFVSGENEVYLDGPGEKTNGQWEVKVYDVEPNRCAEIALFARQTLNGFDGIIAGTMFEGMYASFPTSDTEEDDAAPNGFWYVRRFEVTSFFSEGLTPLSYRS